MISVPDPMTALIVPAAKPAAITAMTSSADKRGSSPIDPHLPIREARNRSPAGCAASLAQPAATPSAAFRSSATSSFLIFIIACHARSAFVRSGSLKSSSIPSGRPARRARTCPGASRTGSLAAVGEALPVVVDLGLVLAGDHERDGLVELELRPAVDADEVWPFSSHSTVTPCRPTRALRVVGDLRDPAVVEDVDVEVGGLLGVAVEPQVGGDLLRHFEFLSSRAGSAPRRSFRYLDHRRGQ